MKYMFVLLLNAIKDENGFFLSAVERPLSPHTTFEELVASQAQELEDAMITEVMAFYKTWSRKLEEIKKKNLRECELDDQKIDMSM